MKQKSLTTTPKKPSLVITTPCYNEEESIIPLYNEIQKHISDIVDVQFFFVDDGSKDNTWNVIQKLSEKENVGGLRLSRNFGKENALYAGIKEAPVSDYYLTMDADLQDDPSIISQMFDKAHREGYEVVFGKRVKRYETFLHKQFTNLFYYIMNKSTKGMFPSDVADFYLLSSRVRENFLLLNENVRYNRGLLFFLGFKQAAVYYDRNPRKFGKSTFNYLKLLFFAVDAITSFSTMPLHVISVLSVIGCVASVVIGVAYVSLSLFFGVVAISGWPSLILFIVFFGSLQTFMLGIISEYVGRMAIEVKNRPNYFIDIVIEPKRKLT